MPIMAGINGQGLVETCMVLAVVMLMSVSMVPTVGLIAARLWVTNALYNRMRCELRQNSMAELAQCNIKLKHDLQPIWWGSLVNCHVSERLSPNGRIATVHALWCNSTNNRIENSDGGNKCPAKKQLNFNLKIRESYIKDSRLWG